MATKKISELTALASGSVASSTDVLAIVDTTANTTNKITIDNLTGNLGRIKSAYPFFADYEASLQTTGTIAFADDSIQVGKYCTVTADAQTLTLPAAVVGGSFYIVNNAADAGALLTISPQSGEKFLVDIAGAAGTNNKDIINTKATQKQYDFVKLMCINTDGYFIDEVRGTWVDEA